MSLNPRIYCNDLSKPFYHSLLLLLESTEPLLDTLTGDVGR